MAGFLQSVVVEFDLNALQRDQALHFARDHDA
jgi:hypothetical protein